MLETPKLWKSRPDPMIYSETDEWYKVTLRDRLTIRYRLSYWFLLISIAQQNIDVSKYHDIEYCPEMKECSCKKCGACAVIFIRRAGSYCRDCLLASVIHKFRGCLGKSRIVRKNDRVLIAYSGGQASTMMLYLVQNMLDESTLRRTIIQPVVVYIDESALHDDVSTEVYESNVRKVVGLAKRFCFPTFVSPLEIVMCDEDDSDSTMFVDGDEFGSANKQLFDDALRIRLKKMFESISDLTSKEDLLQKLRNVLLAKVAVKLNCSKIFVGDCQDRLAVRLLSDIAFGNGQFLPKTVGLADNRFDGVTLVRPLREISGKEISFCANLLKLETHFNPSLTTKQSSSASIHTLTEKFVLGLQEDFPATVSTIFRTGDKLGSSVTQTKETSLNQDLCIICSGCLDPRPAEQDLFKVNNTSQNHVKCNCKCSTEDALGYTNNHCLILKDASRFCCYSCGLILKDMKDASLLPSQILNKVLKSLKRLQMKNQISEFLLDPTTS